MWNSGRHMALYYRIPWYLPTLVDYDEDYYDEDIPHDFYGNYYDDDIEWFWWSIGSYYQNQNVNIMNQLYQDVHHYMQHVVKDIIKLYVNY